jgi:F0F1-type ATP synthase assembly protein I
MLTLLINILIIIVVGAICFYLIDRFVRDARLGNLLKILVGLICLAAIVQRLLPILGVNF